MLRFICNGNVAAKSVNSLASRFIRCMSAQQSPQTLGQRRPFRERLEVNVCGRLSDPAFELPNGTVVISIVTKNDKDEHFAKHRTILTSPKLRDLVADGLTENQRVYVSGVIGYNEFQNNKGQRRYSGVLIANELYLCEENEDSNTDVNEVKLFGRVEQQPQNTDHSTFLQVSTLFFDRTTQSNQKKFHTILIQDDDNLRQRASGADINATVFIHGSLKTQLERNQDEKFRNLYLIRPKKLIFTQQREKNLPLDVHDDEF